MGERRSVDDKGTSHVRAKSWRTNKDLTLHECHDPPWAGHPGWHRTLALLERRYYRPNIRDEVEEYVTIYLICQQDKTFTTKLDMALAG